VCINEVDSENISISCSKNSNMKQGINLDALVVLDAIARKGSFAAAAEELYRVPSSITYAIQKLEEGLGVTLFDRRGHRANLTPAGEALLLEGRDLLRVVDGVERNVQRVATGWESELRIAVDDLIPYSKVLDVCEAFYKEVPDTRLSISTEVLEGAWDALVSGRVDFVIGAPGDGPSGGGYTTYPMGGTDFLFVVAPDHPLAKEQKPLTSNQIRSYRAVAVADSSRGLPRRTVGILPGQQVLTVPNLRVKRDAQIRGMGVGYMAKHLVEEDVSAGRLLVKETEDGMRNKLALHYVWRTKHQGKALEWFKEYLCQEGKQYSWFS
jgi:DNA-binding transcriptional LysR family regulator